MSTILFPAEPFSPRTIDSAFEAERDAAAQAGFGWALIDHTLVTQGQAAQAVRLVPATEGDVLYRGWMLTADQYASLFAALASRAVHLRTSPAAYRCCHELPESYAFIEGHTPRSTWAAIRGEPGRELLRQLTEPFGDGALIVKDYVKSQKHYWDEACFIPRASDLVAVERVARRFLQLQGDDLNVGLVFREYVPLRRVGSHPQSGMPLCAEFRLFWFGTELLLAHRYWGDIVEISVEPPIAEFVEIAKRIPSDFFTMDIAQREDGDWTIVELGDGQVAGLPSIDLAPRFYQDLLRRMQ